MCKVQEFILKNSVIRIKQNSLYIYHKASYIDHQKPYYNISSGSFATLFRRTWCKNKNATKVCKVQELILKKTVDEIHFGYIAKLLVSTSRSQIIIYLVVLLQRSSKDHGAKMKARIKNVQCARIHSLESYWIHSAYINKAFFMGYQPYLIVIIKYRKWFFRNAIQERIIQKKKRTSKMCKAEEFLLKKRVIGI